MYIVYIYIHQGQKLFSLSNYQFDLQVGIYFTWGVCAYIHYIGSHINNIKKAEKNEKNKKNIKYFLVAESLCFVGFATFEELPETKK